MQVCILLLGTVCLRTNSLGDLVALLATVIKSTEYFYLFSAVYVGSKKIVKFTQKCYCTVLVMNLQ